MCTGLIDLARPVSKEKVRYGFQPHWRTVFIYRCPQCGKETRVYASKYRGKTPVPETGAIKCTHENPGDANHRSPFGL